MGYNFDLAKMPGDMKKLFYQAAVKEGNKTIIDSELEYSLFFSRSKNLLDSGKASFSKDVFDDIFSVKIHQNVKTPTENDANRIIKLVSDPEQSVEVEKIDKNLYRFSQTYGDLKKLDYAQTVGTVKIGENSCYSNGKTYTFYQNGSMEVCDTKDGTATLYDSNNTIIQ